MTYVLEGTGEEIATLLQTEPFANLKLRVYVDPDQDDTVTNLPPPTYSVRDRDHLVALLLEGARSGPGVEATPEFWAQKEVELLDRHNNPSHR